MAAGGDGKLPHSIAGGEKIDGLKVIYGRVGSAPTVGGGISAGTA
jgi:hypothetical protein